MSLANRCDRCGSLIPGEANFEKENFDLAVMMGSEIVVSFEDLCPNCTKAFNALLASFEHKEEKPEKPEPPKPPKPKRQKAQKAVEEQKDAEENETPEAEPKEQKPLANKVVKKIPIDLKRPNER